MTETTAQKRQRSDQQRKIVRRIITKGNLVLQTPACVSNGEIDGLTDLNLLRDSFEPNRALLTGSTIAGALRNYILVYHRGFNQPEGKTDRTTKLLGGTRRDNDGLQSALIIDDAISEGQIEAELRDGVGIVLKTGIADPGAKYDFELLKARTVFPLRFELLIDSREEAHNLIQTLAIALQGLENGEIPVGMKKQRGFGQCKVDAWQVWQFDMREERDRNAWLWFDRDAPTSKEPQEKIAEILKIELPDDQRDRFILKADFQLEGAMLIRAGHGDLNAPDVVHLTSSGKPIISGTSLAGVLRHRATRILNTLNIDLKLRDEIFGFVNEKNKENSAHISRLVVDESEIKGGTDLVQNRIAIDRFTGGTLNGALFDEQPVFGNGKATVEITLELRDPKCCEIGLLLLLLKDLWTSDLAIGGSSSIGRGRLKGIKATMIHKQRNWKIEQLEDKLDITGSEEMEACVQALVKSSEVTT